MSDFISQDLAAIVENDSKTRIEALVGLMNYVDSRDDDYFGKSKSNLIQDLNIMLYKEIPSAEDYVVDTCLKIKNEKIKSGALEQIAKSGTVGVAIKLLDEVAKLPDEYFLKEEKESLESISDIFLEPLGESQKTKEYIGIITDSIKKYDAEQKEYEEAHPKLFKPQYLKAEYTKMKILCAAVASRTDDARDYAFKLLLETKNEKVKAKGLLDLAARNVENQFFNENQYKLCVESVIELKDKEITGTTLYQMSKATLDHVHHLSPQYEPACNNLLVLLSHADLFEDYLKQDQQAGGKFPILGWSIKGGTPTLIVRATELLNKFKEN